MTRTGRCRLLCCFALAACDPVHSLHLKARVTARGAPVENAWVISLSKTPPRGAGAVRTGRDGAAGAVFSAFLGSPMADPIAIHSAAHGVFVALPERDFVPRRRGWLFARDWDVELAVDLARAPPRTAPMTCGTTTCTVGFDALPGACVDYLVQVSAQEARAAPVERQGGGSLPLPFQPPPEAELFVVAVCYREAGPPSVAVSAAARR